MKNICLIIAIGLSSQLGFSQKVTEINFQAQFDRHGVVGCFILYDQQKEEFISHNASRCDSGYIPASTFKIPHSLIALEEGLVPDADQIIKWNGHVWPHQAWNHDQTLATAVKYSCVWIFSGFAEQLGTDKYYDYVRKFDYGNQDLTGPPSRFWLTGSFRMSAHQQIDFLRKFYFYELPVAKRSIDIVKEIIILEQTDSYTLSGKTGGSKINNTEYIMWLVGYVEKNHNVYFFVTNFTTTDYSAKSEARYALTRDILRELKLIE
ncbi:MAG: penicillin-binding transpeptidase domain-containing protein [Candidatus Marinimicrobia bacterium]|jgi:beta-lactamase class D|nr:penicillin-binding transpeptidase domain-containing protein [Candidatus Neomarinimicrobiota bacterium]